MSSTVMSVAERMGVPRLWTLGYRGRGVTVAILDSGIVPNPSYADQIVYDEDFTGEGHPRDQDHRHGTEVAECVLTVAPEATIANLRVVPANSELTRDIVIRALRHCMEVYPKYRVINVSLSFQPDNCPDGCSLCGAVDEAFKKGMLVNVAAGNTGPEPDTLTCPARAHWALVHVATWPHSTAEYWDNMGWLKRFWYMQVTGKFGEWYGTSYSAGYSSGEAAVLFSAFPRLDADTLRFANLEVATAMHNEKGCVTTLKTDRVYDYLLWLRQLDSTGAIVTKEGALRPFLDSF